MNTNRDRVISVVLTDEDWKALLQVHPQPAQWIRERIQESIDASRADLAHETPQNVAQC
jgi:hypothetical protein